MLGMRIAITALAVALFAPGATVQAQSVTVGEKDKGKRASARPTSGAEAELLANAAMRGDVVSVRALLAKGVDPNVRGDSLGKTPLRMATSLACTMSVPEKDVLAVVDALIAGGADVNEVDRFGHGVLLMTAQKCKGAVVTRLLEAGADPERRDPQGLSPLSMALIVKNYDAATALVDSGVRLSAASMAKIFPEPPTEPEVLALVKRATASK